MENRAVNMSEVPQSEEPQIKEPQSAQSEIEPSKKKIVALIQRTITR